jgi:hypothetical protein
MEKSVPVDSIAVDNRFNARRRQFLKQSSGLTFGFAFANLMACSEPASNAKPNASALSSILLQKWDKA